MKYIAIAGLLVMISFNAARSQAPISIAKPSSDEAAIRLIIQQVQNGWNAHDAKAFAAPFAADADYVVVNGMHLKGRAEIESGHAQIFATVYKESRNQATIKSIRFLRPDVALVHLEWNLEFTIDGTPQKGHAMNTVVMTKEGEKWGIAAFHNTPIRPPGPPPGPPPAK